MKRLYKNYSYIDNSGICHNISIYENTRSNYYSIYVDDIFYSTAENVEEAEEEREDIETVYKLKPQALKF